MLVWIDLNTLSMSLSLIIGSAFKFAKVLYSALSLLSIFLNSKTRVVTNLKPFTSVSKSIREHRQLGFVTLNGNLAVSGWVGLAYDR